MGLFGKGTVKEGGNGSKAGESKRPNVTDTLYKQIRILNERIATVELQLSTLRRDVARIDRKQYREVPKEEVKPEPEKPKTGSWWEG